jgi:hypothetical protein
MLLFMEHYQGILQKISKPFEYSFRLDNFNVHFRGRPACLIENAMNCRPVVKACRGGKGAIKLTESLVF